MFKWLNLLDIYDEEGFTIKVALQIVSRDFFGCAMWHT